MTSSWNSTPETFGTLKVRCPLWASNQKVNTLFNCRSQADACDLFKPANMSSQFSDQGKRYDQQENNKIMRKNVAFCFAKDKTMIEYVWYRNNTNLSYKKLSKGGEP